MVYGSSATPPAIERAVTDKASAYGCARQRPTRPQTIPETRTLRRIKEALRKRWHDNRHKTAKWRVIKGCYYAVPGSSESLQGFIYQCKRLRALRRRSQKDRTEWRDMDTLIEAHWPKASIRGQTSALSSGEEPDANSASPDLCGGTGETRFPTAIGAQPREFPEPKFRRPDLGFDFFESG